MIVQLKNKIFFAFKILMLVVVQVYGSDEATQVEQVTQNPLCIKIATQNLHNFQRVDGPSIGDSVQDPYAFYNYLTETISNPSIICAILSMPTSR